MHNDAINHVFTYGSLMFAEVWTRVVEGEYRSKRARLDGHARFAVRDQTYPGMVAQANSQVEGVLYLDVDDADLARLDHFEGDDYVRTRIEVVSEDGILRATETYLYRWTDRLLTASWQPEAFAMERFLDTYCRDKFDR